MLINCPSFNAAPRICESFETSRLMFASVIITDDGSEEPEPVLRRTSAAAPYPSDAASPNIQFMKSYNDRERKTDLRNEIISLCEMKEPWRTGDYGRRVLDMF